MTNQAGYCVLYDVDVSTAHSAQRLPGIVMLGRDCVFVGGLMPWKRVVWGKAAMGR